MATEPKPTLSLHRKLAQVMYEAERIPKNGQAPKEMGGYRFVQVGDAADYIRKALAEKVITMMPTKVTVVGQTEHQTKSGGSMTTVDLITEWTLTDGESGEKITIEAFGAGADGGDKYSGKASTSAMKYALLTGFLLSTGDDTEAGTSPERGPREHPGLVDGDPKPRPELIRTTGNDGLIGKVATSGTQDFELRETPDGWVLPFRLKEGAKAGQIVIAHDDLAKALRPFRDTLMGERVTVWGRYSDEESPPKADGFVVRYKVLHLERIQTADWTLPAQVPPEEVFDAAEREAMYAAAALVGEGPLAPDKVSEPMFPDEDEAAAILAADLEEARQDELRMERLGEAKDAAGYPG